MVMHESLETVAPPKLERRRFQRWALERPARFSAHERSATGTVRDISAGGALIQLDRAADVPERVLLYLFLSSIDGAPAAILARVVEVRGRRVRVAFDPLPQFVADAIAAEIRAARRPARTASAFLN